MLPVGLSPPARGLHRCLLMGSEGLPGVRAADRTDSNATTASSQRRLRLSSTMGRARSLGAVLTIVIGACGASTCSHGSSTSAPTSSLPATVDAPSPVPGDLTLTGRVAEAPPTSSTGIWDALVTLQDGVGVWQSGRTI